MRCLRARNRQLQSARSTQGRRPTFIGEWLTLWRTQARPNNLPRIAKPMTSARGRVDRVAPTTMRDLPRAPHSMRRKSLKTPSGRPRMHANVRFEPAGRDARRPSDILQATNGLVVCRRRPGAERRAAARADGARPVGAGGQPGQWHQAAAPSAEQFLRRCEGTARGCQGRTQVTWRTQVM